MSSAAQNIVSRYVHRQVLLLSLILLAGLFVITAALAKTYHAREEGLAAEWLANGNADMESGKATLAIEDFRNSLTYGPDNALAEIRLAEALLAADRLTEARSYLVNLWDRDPGSGKVNLDLAHVSLQSGDTDQTVRYFRGAIFGSWEGDPAVQRRKVRLEFCEFLLSHQMASDARTEIAGLAADTPPDDGALREENGRLFMRVGEPGKALAEFEAAVKIDPTRGAWLTDAGQVAFENGDYLKAENYFSRAERENPSDEIHAALVLVRDVLGNDPFLAGLSEEEQARRTWHDFQQGLDRLHKCSAAGPNNSPSDQANSQLHSVNQDAQELQKEVDLSSLGKSPGMRNETMQLVSKIEEASSQVCGPAAGLDQALTLIEKRQEGNNP